MKAVRSINEGAVLTYSVGIGEWLEDHRFASGLVEIHAVTAHSRVIQVIDPAKGCETNSKAYNGPSLWEALPGVRVSREESFEDEDLRILVGETSEQGLIYVWSPKMPLSVSGIAPFRALAANLGLKATVLMDPMMSAAAADVVKQQTDVPTGPILWMRSAELVRRGALLHFPSLVVYAHGQIVGAPILGNRGSAGWESLVKDRLVGFRTELARSASRQAPELRAAAAVEVATTTAVPLSVTVRKASLLPKTFGYFAKPIWGTRWVGVHIDWANSYFFNLDTSSLIDLGYTNDTYVTPSDHLYTTFWATPGSVGGGELGIVETAELLKEGLAPSPRPAPLLVDPTIAADYQSVGTLRSDAAGATYRVITGGYNNYLTYRDYRMIHRTALTRPSVTPVAPTGYLCSRLLGDASFGTPILSKDGREIAVQKADGTTAVFAIDAQNPQVCVEVLSFPFSTGKVAFRFDSQEIAFHLNDDLYLFRRPTHQLFQLTGLKEAVGDGAAWFPEFREDGSLVVPYIRRDGAMMMVELDPPAIP